MFIIYNKNLRPIFEITKFYSIIWNELWLDVNGGDFEIELPYAIYKNKFQNGFFVENTESKTGKIGIITEIVKTYNDEKGFTIKIVGSMAESILQKRVIHPKMNITGTINDIVELLLNRNIIYPATPERTIEFFKYISHPEFDAEISKQYLGQYLGDAIYDICIKNGCSYKVYKDGNYLAFELLKRSEKLIYFTDDQNAYTDFTYLKSDSNKASHCVVIGEDTDKGAENVVVGYTAEGINRIENYVDGSNISSAELSSTLYKSKLKEQGMAELKKHNVSTAIEFSINNNILKYGVDYNLGDAARVSNSELGVYEDQVVLGIEYFIEETTAFSYKAIVGESPYSTEATEQELQEEAESPNDDKKETSNKSIINFLNNDSYLYKYDDSNLLFCIYYSGSLLNSFSIVLKTTSDKKIANNLMYYMRDIEVIVSTKNGSTIGTITYSNITENEDGTSTLDFNITYYQEFTEDIVINMSKLVKLKDIKILVDTFEFTPYYTTDRAINNYFYVFKHFNSSIHDKTLNYCHGYIGMGMVGMIEDYDFIDFVDDGIWISFELNKIPPCNITNDYVLAINNKDQYIKLVRNTDYVIDGNKFNLLKESIPPDFCECEADNYNSFYLKIFYEKPNIYGISLKYIKGKDIYNLYTDGKGVNVENVSDLEILKPFLARLAQEISDNNYMKDLQFSYNADTGDITFLNFEDFGPENLFDGVFINIHCSSDAYTYRVDPDSDEYYNGLTEYVKTTTE